MRNIEGTGPERARHSLQTILSALSCMLALLKLLPSFLSLPPFLPSLLPPLLLPLLLLLPLSSFLSSSSLFLFLSISTSIYISASLFLPHSFLSININHFSLCVTLGLHVQHGEMLGRTVPPQECLSTGITNSHRMTSLTL